MKKNIYNNTIKYFILTFTTFFLASFSVTSSVLDITEDDFYIGDKNAPVTIIEYASLSCSHCANFHLNTLPKVIEEYVNTGKVKFVFRDFPFNYPALLGTMLLRCIPNEIRLEYSKSLYAFQKRWVVRDNKKSTEELFKIMQSGGMTKNDFNNCIEDKDLENEIVQQLMEVQNEFKIQSTPSFLINGLLVEGYKSIANFRKIIEKELSK